MAIKIILVLTFISFIILLYTLHKICDSSDKEVEEISYQGSEDFELCDNACYQCGLSQKCWELLNHMEV